MSLNIVIHTISASMKFSEFVDLVNKIKALHCLNIKLCQYQAAEMLEGYTVSKVSYDFIWKLE